MLYEPENAKPLSFPFSFLNPYRRKAWNYFTVFSPDHLLYVSIGDLGFVPYAFVTMVQRNSSSLGKKEVITVL